MYIPDRWMLIEIKGDDPHYRIFGSWYGSYLAGSSWRINSGITYYTEDLNFYYFHGSSGSVYRCHKQNYGISAYGATVLAHYTKDPNVVALLECPDISRILEKREETHAL